MNYDIINKLKKVRILTILLIFTLAVRQLFCQYSEYCDVFYTRGIFPYIRILLNCTFGILPFASVYVIFPMLILYFLNKIRRINIADFRQNIAIKMIDFCISIFNIISIIIVLFFWLWGFNYCSTEPEKIMRITSQNSSENELYDMLLVSKDTLEKMTKRSDFQNRYETINTRKIDSLVKQFCSQNINNQLIINKYLPNTAIRQIQPNGWLSGFGASGIYNLFTGECNIDNDLHHIQKPSTIAHEFTHAYGITDEGFCNFVAYIVCSQSPNFQDRYSAELMFWRTIAREYKQFDPEKYANLRSTLSAEIITDLNDINKTILEKPVFIENHTEIYDHFLKAQGEEEGVLSYDKVIGLVRAWRLKK